MTESTINLVCSECLSVNRVPEGRLSDGPKCGRCGHPLAPGSPIELNDRSFEKWLQRTGVPVVVDFWAPWCGPCRMMAPAFADAAAQLSPRTLLGKLDTESYPQPASGLGISGIPTLILFRSGREIDRISGAMTTPQIVQWVQARR